MAPPQSEATRLFGRAILGARVSAGLTQGQLAELCGLHFTNVARLERGEIQPLLHTIIQLESALGLMPGGLLAGIGSAALPNPRAVTDSETSSTSRF